jgi:hypothetical protein
MRTCYHCGAAIPKGERCAFDEDVNNPGRRLYKCAACRAAISSAASALGKLGKGKSKTLSQAERARRAFRFKIARLNRWPQRHD